jgi:hypothetical protein
MPRVRRRPGRPRRHAGRYPSAAATIPVPQRQLQALGAYQAGGADGDRRGRLPAGLVCLHTDREPLVGVKAAVSAPGVPDDPGPQGLIGERDGHRRIRRPDSGRMSRVCEAGPESAGAGGRETAICSLFLGHPVQRDTWPPAKLPHLISASAGTALTLAAGVSVLGLVAWRGRSVPSAPRPLCPAPQPARRAGANRSGFAKGCHQRAGAAARPAVSWRTDCGLARRGRLKRVAVSTPRRAARPAAPQSPHRTGHTRADAP